MSKRFKVQIRLVGSAFIEVDADTPEQARRAAMELSLADIARPGYAELIEFQVAPREITAAGPHGTSDDDDAAAERPRPSGWYRSK
ncbi:MAG: hypothetical protein ACLQVD_05915 [Capsulimonadaceae bacterium]